MRWSQRRRIAMFLGGGFALVLQGCHGCRTADFPVSSPPGDPSGAHRTFSQSETTMVRIDQPTRPRGEPAARYLTAYNDATSAMRDAGGACWAFNAAQPSLASKTERLGGADREVMARLLLYALIAARRNSP